MATNETYVVALRAEIRKRRRQIAGGAVAEDDLSMEDLHFDDEKLEATYSALRASRSAVGAPSVGDDLFSQIDGRSRLILALPPQPPSQQNGGWLRGHKQVPLPSPATMAAPLGGMRARPVRACPDWTCSHPLPMSIDDRDPFVVAIVGNTKASKTTLILALAAQAMNGAVRPLGLTEFSPTAPARLGMREDLELYRSGHDVKQTDVGKPFYEPMEFLMGFGQHLPNVVLLIHDIAGETYMDSDSRLEHAAHLIWADAVVFVVNPEETPGLGTVTSDTDQATVLTGVYDEIVHGASLRRAAGLDDVPPLLVLLSKADLLGEHALDSPDPGESQRVARSLERLGATDILLAAQRWPHYHLSFVSPQPKEGRATGVVKAFEHVFAVMTGRQP